MNKQHLEQAVYCVLGGAKNPRSKETARLAVNAALDEIERGVRRDGEFMLVGFGRFFVRTRPARKNFNLRTGEMDQLEARQVAMFAPGCRLKKAAAEHSSTADSRQKHAE